MHSTTLTRIDFAAELRGYADEVRDLRLADRRDPEKPILAKRDLEQRMRNRAETIAATDEPPQRGRIISDSGKMIRGRRVVVEVRRARLQKAA